MSQQEIHKIDFSDKEMPPSAYFDSLMSDLREQIIKVAEAKTDKDRNLAISMMGEYLRGLRDGNRFYRPSPFKDKRSNNI